MRPDAPHAKARAALLLAVLLTACGGSQGVYSGVVTGAGGNPLSGVVVSASDGSTLTDDSGRWQISTHASRLEFDKPGYQKTTVAASTTVLSLPPAASPLQVVFDDRWDDLPSSGLQGWLAGQGMRVYDLKQGLGPATADVTVLLSPAYFSTWALQPQLEAVRSGQTLIVAGQWGGYVGSDLGTLNALTQGTGIQFDGSLVRDRAATDDPNAFLPQVVDPASDPGPAPEFFSAGALFVASPARVLLQSSSSSYRVDAWSDGPQIVGAVAPLGAGKIIALSDAACFSDLAQGTSKTPGWKTAGNPQLALDLVDY